MREFKGYRWLHPVFEHPIPVLDLANKTVLPKTLQA